MTNYTILNTLLNLICTYKIVLLPIVIWIRLSTCWCDRRTLFTIFSKCEYGSLQVDKIRLFTVKRRTFLYAHNVENLISNVRIQNLIVNICYYWKCSFFFSITLEKKEIRVSHRFRRKYDQASKTFKRFPNWWQFVPALSFDRGLLQWKWYRMSCIMLSLDIYIVHIILFNNYSQMVLYQLILLIRRINYHICLQMNYLESE